jgi:hypothetical protein
VECNSLIACIARRHVLIHSAYTRVPFSFSGKMHMGQLLATVRESGLDDNTSRPLIADYEQPRYSVGFQPR